MTPERARELLGGLATGILTPEERETLFEAALHDQTLFNEVADELEFAVFLQAPETRAQLANKIEVEPERPRRWVLGPRWLALSGVLAASAVLTVVLWHKPAERVQEAVQQPVVVESPRAATPEEISPKKEVAPPVMAVPPKRRVMTSPEPAPPPLPSPAPMAPRMAPMAAARTMGGLGGNGLMASLEGTVHDASGAAVNHATIDIVNTATNTTTKTLSDAEGKFVAPPLAPGGPYTVTAAAPGFKKEERSGVTLAVNQPARIDIPLQVGPAADSVVVTGATSQLNALRQVAVLNFVNGANAGDLSQSQSQSQSGQQAADMLSDQLDFNGNVRVIGREKVQRAQQAQSAAQAGPPSAQQAADLGRKLGADAVIVGTVKDKESSNSDVAVTAQVIDSQKARPMPKVFGNAASLKGATSQVGRALESQLATPLEGKITRVEANTVTVVFQAPGEPRIGGLFDVYRGQRKIGQLRLTSILGQTATGKFSGEGQPQADDRVTSSR